RPAPVWLILNSLFGGRNSSPAGLPPPSRLGVVWASDSLKDCREALMIPQDFAAPTVETKGRPALSILLANPRGFCAGVERAILIVERSLERYGKPVYVRHEIVHNRVVVERLEAKGAIFVEELDEVPDGAPVIFSAHGVPKSVPAEAQRRNLFYLD